MEIWREIKGTNGRILVSNYGRVRSLLRDDRILKLSKDPKGYMRLRVTIDGKKLGYKVHRLVAELFLENKNNLPQVNHKDGNKENNNVSNLEWISNIDNAKHAMANGLWDNVKKASCETNEKRKVPIVSVNIKTGEQTIFSSISEAERTIGTRHISDVLNKKREQAKGYRFFRIGGDDNAPQ